MDFKNKIMEPESKQFIRHETKNKNPDKWGWYDTDKGSLFWYEMENIWSCNQDRVSAEYPRYWYEEVALSSPLKSSIDVKIVEQIKRDLIFLYKNREFNELEQYVLNLIPTEGMKLWDEKGMTKIAEAVHQWMSSDDGGPFATLDELVAAHLLGIPPFLIHKDSKEKLYRNKRCDGCIAEPKDKICSECLGVNGEFEEVIFHKDKEIQNKAKWDKLNKEFDNVLDNLTDEQWDEWIKNRKSSHKDKREDITKAKFYPKFESIISYKEAEKFVYTYFAQSRKIEGDIEENWETFSKFLDGITTERNVYFGLMRMFCAHILISKGYDTNTSSTPLDKEGYGKKEVSLIEELRDELYGLMDFCIDGGHIDLDDDSIERVKTYKEVMNKAGKFIANPPLQKDKEEMTELTDDDIEKEAKKRYGEVTGGQYHAARPLDIARFIKGAKWYRDRLKNK